MARKELYKVQKRVAFKARATDGRRLGQVWETIATKRNLAVAERVAACARIDNPDSTIRIERRPCQ